MIAQSFLLATSIVFFLALCLSEGSFAQMDWAEYYPLHNGNLWEYREYMDFPTYPPLTITREVVGDTVAPNGHTYKIIRVRTWDGPFPGTAYEYERIDTSGNVFAYIELDCQFPSTRVDTLLLKLGGVKGDRVPAPCRGPSTYWALTTRDSGMFFGSRELIRFDLTNDVVRGVKVTASGIGLAQEGFEGGNLILEGAMINGKTFGEITVSVGRDDNYVASDWRIRAFPNPFNSETRVEYAVEQPEAVDVSIYDLLGRRVTTLFKGVQISGFHSVVWNGRSGNGRQVASGVYLAVFRSGAAFSIGKLILTK